MSQDVLAIIPARAGSKGIPNKNFRTIANGPCVTTRALYCAYHALESWDHVVLTTDAMWPSGVASTAYRYVRRPSELAQDDTPMIDVVRHVLQEVQGPEDQIILLVQPTQPLRKPEHLKAAIRLLKESGADSVVSVVELPATHSPELACQVIACPSGEIKLRPWPYESSDGESMRPWSEMPTRRQIARPACIRDGTVYAFYRRNVAYGHIYGCGDRVWPMIVGPEDTCPLDSPADWFEAERRLRAREAVA